jgi:8-oxo-dGTP diphosphatase
MNKILQTWKKNMTEEKKLKHIASVYIFNDKEEVLLIKRSKTAEKDPHIWEVPGGHVDPEDSSYEAAAKREAKEESGLSVSNLKHLEDQEYHNRIKHIYVTENYTGKVEIVANPDTGIVEHSDHMWASMEDIISLNKQTRVSRYLMKKAISILRGKK